MRVFIVDDSALLRTHLAEIVAAIPGATVTGEASDADAALAGIRATAPDVVILDAVFPGGGGGRVLDLLGNDAPGPAVLVLTNHAEPEYRAEFLRRGVAGFFDKALELPELVAALRDRAVRAGA